MAKDGKYERLVDDDKRELSEYMGLEVLFETCNLHPWQLGGMATNDRLPAFDQYLGERGEMVTVWGLYLT